MADDASIVYVQVDKLNYPTLFYSTISAYKDNSQVNVGYILPDGLVKGGYFRDESNFALVPVAQLEVKGDKSVPFCLVIEDVNDPKFGNNVVDKELHSYVLEAAVIQLYSMKKDEMNAKKDDADMKGKVLTVFEDRAISHAFSFKIVSPVYTIQTPSEKQPARFVKIFIY
jgi:hypothetical protein